MATATTGIPNLIRRGRIQQLTSRGTVTVLDVRPGPEYAAGHIPGAVSIPLAELAELADRLAELPDDGQIVAYCRGAYCVLAPEAVRLLAAHGRPAQHLASALSRRPCTFSTFTVPWADPWKFRPTA